MQTILDMIFQAILNGDDIILGNTVLGAFATGSVVDKILQDVLISATNEVERLFERTNITYLNC